MQQRTIRNPFRSLKHREFRWFWFGVAAMSAAQGMQFLTLGWLTLELTDSMSRFGLVIFCFGITNACFIAVGGVFADKINL